VVAAPEVEALHAVDHAQYTLWVFAVPLLAAALIEAPIAVVSDRWPRRRLLALGLLGLAFALGWCALARGAWLLSAGLALAGAASGVACGAAQAELVMNAPGGAARAMSRWVAFGAIGDALTPLLIAALSYAGGSHRSALAVLAGLLCLQAVCSYWAAPAPVPTAASGGPAALDQPAAADASEEDAPALPLMAAMRASAGKPRLWLLLAASSSCLLLDEVLVALAALRLHDDCGWSQAEVAAVLTSMSLGAALGALASERLLARVPARALLLGSAACSLVCLGGFIAGTLAGAPTSWLAAASLFLLDVSAAPHYPVVKAAAYEAAAGRPGTVNALASAFVGVEIVLPLLLGVVASRFGLAAALAILALQPLIMLAVALSGILRSRVES